MQQPRLETSLFNGLHFMKDQLNSIRYQLPISAGMAISMLDDYMQEENHGGYLPALYACLNSCIFAQAKLYRISCGTSQNQRFVLKPVSKVYIVKIPMLPVDEELH